MTAVDMVTVSKVNVHVNLHTVALTALKVSVCLFSLYLKEE